MPGKHPRILRLSVLALAGLVLAACGTKPEERAVTGAGIGAAGGAIIGAVTGLSVIQGAVIGAAAGGLTGALTDKATVDLGDPVWKKGEAKTAAAKPELVRKIQAGLAEAGYDPGSADGVMGERTEAAIRAYQSDHELLVDGRPSPELAAHIGASNVAATD